MRHFDFQGQNNSRCEIKTELAYDLDKYEILCPSIQSVVFGTHLSGTNGILDARGQYL